MRTDKFVRYMRHLECIIMDDDMDDDMKLYNIRENIKDWVKNETWRNPGAEVLKLVRKEDEHTTTCSPIDE
jgi:hypothetical protein